MNVLELEPILRIRQNHALEHATIHLLTGSDPTLRLVGRSTPKGFYLYGLVDTQAVADAASEALARLQGGERDLAVHPRCGTGVATAGVLAGLAAFVTLRTRRRLGLSDLPAVITATTLAVMASQPLGLKVQQEITTTPDLRGVRISAVRRNDSGRLITHQVRLERD
jgi:hypothetical protein